MEAWMAFVSIIAIVAIVLVAGALIAVIGHMIIGSFDTEKKAKKSSDTVEYTQIKQLEDSKSASVTDEYDFEKLDESKAQLEKEELEKVEDEVDFALVDEEVKDEDIQDLENRLKEAGDEDLGDDLDIEDLINEISDEVTDEEKSKMDEESVEMSEELKAYNIDDVLNKVDETEEEDALEGVSEEVEEEVETESESEEVNRDKLEIEALKKQLEELNRQLEEVKNVKVETVTIDMTEEECLARLAILEDRLKSVKREYKINAKEYRPLRKVVKDLEKYQDKYRRKNTQLAKKKIALYAVNNYVDLDRDKAQEISNEIELVEGLKLSVEHCEQIIEANKDRYPVLEHTNKILEDQIAQIEADIESTNKTLQAIRDKKGGNKGGKGNK